MPLFCVFVIVAVVAAVVVTVLLVPSLSLLLCCNRCIYNIGLYKNMLRGIVNKLNIMDRNSSIYIMNY